MKSLVDLAVAFRNHSHNVCMLEITLNDEAYPKDELVKAMPSATAQRVTLQKDDRMNIRLYKVKVPGAGRKYFNYKMEPHDIVFRNSHGEWPREVAIAMSVANLKYTIKRLYEQYCETTRKRYGEFRFALDDCCFDAQLCGYPLAD